LTILKILILSDKIHSAFEKLAEHQTADLCFMFTFTSYQELCRSIEELLEDHERRSFCAQNSSGKILLNKTCDKFVSNLCFKLQPVDMFPHTPHCELVVLFERESSDEVGEVETVDKAEEKPEIAV
jgi:hypothetical protein